MQVSACNKDFTLVHGDLEETRLGMDVIYETKSVHCILIHERTRIHGQLHDTLGPLASACTSVTEFRREKKFRILTMK
jgi:hypothetical protein